ncbi:MAG: TolC family protein [Bacteroidales bacterium]|jgi:outer membrane protein|nr:TolC family protein [Bacteroidales bacterium]
MKTLLTGNIAPALRLKMLFFFLAGASFTVNAQNKWTLRECIDYAVKNNISVKQHELAVETSEQELSNSRNSRLPSLSADVGQNFNFGRSPSMATGIYEENKSASTSFSLSSSMPVFTGMRIGSEIKSNRLNLMAATEGLKKAGEDLSMNIAQYYLEVLFRKEILKVTVEQHTLTAKQTERTESMVLSESAPRSQLYDMKAQLAKDRLNITNATNDLALSLLNLVQLLNLEKTEGFDIVEPELQDSIISGQLQSPDRIYETAVETRPQIKEAEYRLQSSELGVKIAQSHYWPSVNLGMSYNNGFNYGFDAGVNNSSISGQWKNNRREAIGLNMNIPIFNRFQVHNSVKTARLNLQNRVLELETVKLNLKKEIQQAHQSAVAAQTKYASTEEACKAAAEAFTYVEERYGVGKATVYELSEAQAKLFSSRSEQLQAKYEYLFRMKILDFYLGKEME